VFTPTADSAKADLQLVNQVPDDEPASLYLTELEPRQIRRNALRPRYQAATPRD